VSEHKFKHFVVLPAGDEKLRAMLEQKLAEYQDIIKQEDLECTLPVGTPSSDRYRDAFYKVAFLELLLKTGRVDGHKLLFDMAKSLGYGNFSLSDFCHAEEAVYAYVNDSLEPTISKA